MRTVQFKIGMYWKFKENNNRLHNQDFINENLLLKYFYDTTNESKFALSKT